MYLLILRERVGEGQRERERIPRGLCTVSTEPYVGFELKNREKGSVHDPKRVLETPRKHQSSSVWPCPSCLPAAHTTDPGVGGAGLGAGVCEFLR